MLRENIYHVRKLINQSVNIVDFILCPRRTRQRTAPSQGCGAVCDQATRRVMNCCEHVYRPRRSQRATIGGADAIILHVIGASHIWHFATLLLLVLQLY